MGRKGQKQTRKCMDCDKEYSVHSKHAFGSRCPKCSSKNNSKYKYTQFDRHDRELCRNVENWGDAGLYC